MELFYIITMQTRTGKTLYISMWSGKPTWTFNRNEICIWDDKETANKFAKKWFKKFTGWKVKEYHLNVNKICNKIAMNR